VALVEPIVSSFKLRVSVSKKEKARLSQGK
jgi:hypothetical protein